MQLSADAEHRPPGVFGRARAVYGVIETQSRGALHLHSLIWAGLPAAVLQKIAAEPQLVALAAKALDSMFCAELTASEHVSGLFRELDAVTGRALGAAPAGLPRPPACSESPLDVLSYLSRAAEVTNNCGIHHHRTTCRKKDLSQCRLRRPAGHPRFRTSVVQLIGGLGAGGLFTWRVQQPTRLAADAGAERDRDEEPLARLDTRALVWDLMRRMVFLPPSIGVPRGSAVDTACIAPSDNEPVSCPARQCLCFACSPAPLTALLQARVDLLQATDAPLFAKF